MKTPQYKTMPRALTILNYIEANPVCNAAQISHATGIQSPRSYIKAHIWRGKVLETGASRRNLYLQLAEGETAASVYGNGYTKPAPSPALLEKVGRVGFQPHAVQCSVGNELPTLPTKFSESHQNSGLPTLDLSDAAAYAIPTFLKAQPIMADLAKPDAITNAVETLFSLLPPASAIFIGRNDGVLEIDIEADVFGKLIAKTVDLHQVAETLTALHIVTVEMA